MKTVNILGTEYSIEYRDEKEDKLLKDCSGYMDESEHLIVISMEPSDNEKHDYSVMQRITLRHEIVHGFFCESGLGNNCNVFDEPWNLNEEMVDWIARMLPRIYEACKSVEAL